MRVLVELRPALEGHAGIPQETRLLFRGLQGLPEAQVEGLLQTGGRVIAAGLPADPQRFEHWPTHRRLNRLARVIVSMQAADEPGRLARLRYLLRQVGAPAAMLAGALLGVRQSLSRFLPAQFEDFVWRSLFAKTLPVEDFGVVTQARYRVACVPWSAMHAGGVFTRRFGRAVYPRLDTRGYDVMIAETPYPGRVRSPTRLVVRYHDSVPLLMPHTIVDRSFHQAAHYEALKRNVNDGAWFACVSEATRRDLVSIFPQVEPRALSIPNMVSQAYFRDDAPADRIPDILLTRGHRLVDSKAAVYRRQSGMLRRPAFPEGPVEYLLMVSTLEPRKNHLTLLRAWERLHRAGYSQLRLVLVGALGWDSDLVVRKLLPWAARGLVQVLDDVPAAELRLLYRYARVTVCPSLGEGFGYSGVEAMRCGGIVAASELPVHREVYGDAAEYFDPYSVSDLTQTLQRLLGPEAQQRRSELETRGAVVAAQYLPERVLPQWQTFLDGLEARA